MLIANILLSGDHARWPLAPGHNVSNLASRDAFEVVIADGDKVEVGNGSGKAINAVGVGILVGDGVSVCKGPRVGNLGTAVISGFDVAVSTICGLTGVVAVTVISGVLVTSCDGVNRAAVGAEQPAIIRTIIAKANVIVYFISGTLEAVSRISAYKAWEYTQSP